MEIVEDKELRKYCVYLITNLVNGKQYAGKTGSGLKRRKQSHKNSINGNKDTLLLRAFKKHGFDSFAFSILREGLTKYQADEEERLAIRSLRLLGGEFGYNMTEGGDGPEPTSFVPIEEACLEYVLGASANDLAKRYGCDTKTILRRLDVAGMSLRTQAEGTSLAGHKMSANRPNSKSLLPDFVLIRLYKEGWSTLQLGKQFGIHSTTLSVRLEKLGIERRPRGTQYTRNRRFEESSERDAYIQSIRSELETSRKPAYRALPLTSGF